MTRIRKTQYRRKILRKILDIGLLNTLWISLGGCFFYSWPITYSLWWGVFLWVLPNSYFANKLFQSLGKVPPAEQLNVFYRAEIIKLVLSGIIFVMLIQKISINIPALLVGYFMSQVFLAMLLVKSFHNKERFV
jgi:F0F1-type ATP synthase assembly protein I